VVIAIAVLTLVSVAGQVWKYSVGDGSLVRFVDLNRERNLPTWYQGLVLAACTAMLWTIGCDRARRRLGGARYWQSLALVFLYLACDEVFKLHERTIEPNRNALELPRLLALYAWVIPGATAVAVVGLLYLRFVWRLPRPTRNGFVLAGVLYVGGALGMELVSGVYHVAVGYGTYGYIALAHVAEVLEMAGAAVLLHALLEYARRELPNGLASVARPRDETGRRVAATGAGKSKKAGMMDPA
jgi:hypothetical protein